MFTVENQGVNVYLVYSANANEVFDTISLGMISNNRIKGVLPALFTQMDQSRYLKYNISSKIPVSALFKDKISKQKLLGILSGISEAVMSAEEYMIDQSLFVLDTQYIYVDNNTNDVEMICLPVENSVQGLSNFQDFFRQIVCSAQVDFNENCEYIAKLIGFLNGAQIFSLSDFRTFVDSLNVNQSVNNASRNYSQPAQPAPVVSQSSTQVINKPIIKSALIDNKQVKPESNFADFDAKVPEVSVPKEIKKEKKKKNEKKNVIKSQPVEKQVTLLTLLTKYSKENVELYKAQKANKSSSKPVDNKKKEKQADALVPAFAVPNQNVAIPSPAASNTPDPQPVAVPGNSMRNNFVSNAPVKHYTPESINVKAADFGETTILQKPGFAAGDTTVLDVAQIRKLAAAPYLLRDKNGEKVYINKPRFRIGKEKSYVDYFIADNTAISRSHADIITSGNEYSIVDMNSTNHTFVNNEMIASGQEVKLHDGDNVRLANETFTFKVN